MVYHTREAYLVHMGSKVGQKVTVPTNPFGGQCAAFVSYAVRWLYNLEKNLDYTNAIDMLTRARQLGFQVEYFNGSNYNWEVGDIWVTRTTGHQFGHTGIFTSVGKTFTTLEQNVDGNWDALYNGGWVRRKTRTLYSNGATTYSDINEMQYMVGWIKIPFKDRGQNIQIADNSLDKLRRTNSMYGSYFFSVKEKNPMFPSGTLFFYNMATNTVNGIANQDERKIIEQTYKNTFKEDIKYVTYTVTTPWYIRFFEGMGTDIRNRGSRGDELESLINEVKNGNISVLNKLNDLVNNKQDHVKGSSIVNYKSFTAKATLNIRSDAKLDAKILGRINSGQTVNITGSVFADNTYWVIIDHNGSPAYVASKLSDGTIVGELK